MKVTKTQALMLILKMLLENKEISKEDVMKDIDISDLQFHRYMQEIRAFLFNFNFEYKLIYKRSSETYLLIKDL